MELVISDSRYAVAQVEKSRGVQENYNLELSIRLFYSDDPMLYVQILKRNIISEVNGLDRRIIVDGDETAEAILVDKRMDSSMVRKAFNKLDSLSFENFIGDWCIEQGGYQVLDIRGEKK